MISTPITTLPGWEEDNVLKALPALRKSCGAILRSKYNTQLRLSGRAGLWRDWKEVCRRLPQGQVREKSFRKYLKSNFNVFQLGTKSNKSGLFTGYFEPLLRGSLEKSRTYNAPLFPKPSELIEAKLADWGDLHKDRTIIGRVINGRLKPYYTRQQIENGALSGDLKPILWLTSDIDAFFLHVQGSGQALLPDGTTYRIGYAGKNGHHYYPIGRHLIKTGEIAEKDISLQSIRKWLISNPSRKTSIMNLNPSYIFFKRNLGPGPLGAQGVSLTPGRSLAIDRTFVPLGAPVWVVADYKDEKDEPLQRLMVAQDTGGAIKGPIRGDVFWGPGAAAEKLAGPMRALGELYMFLPKTVDAP